jgi:hypothetical protein
MKTPVANSTPLKFRDYLMGYVAGIIYHDGHEWLLTKGGHWQDARPGAPKETSAHVWPTREQALAVARAAHSAKFPAFVRPYVYSTPNPANAAGMPDISEALEAVYL